MVGYIFKKYYCEYYERKTSLVIYKAAVLLMKLMEKL